MKTNVDYWAQKIARNKARDIRNRKLLTQAGWSVIVFWECHVANKTALKALEMEIRQNASKAL